MTNMEAPPSLTLTPLALRLLTLGQGACRLLLVSSPLRVPSYPTEVYLEVSG